MTKMLKNSILLPIVSTLLSPIVALKVKNLKKPLPSAEAASLQETQLPRQCTVVIAMKEITQFDSTCRIGKMRVSVFLWRVE